MLLCLPVATKNVSLESLVSYKCHPDDLSDMVLESNLEVFLDFE